jgi:putative sugar O-methyltransferase
VQNPLKKMAAKFFQILKTYRYFSSNSLASISALEQGLLARLDDGVNANERLHESIIERIMYSYHKAKQEQLKASDPYQAGGEWNELIKRSRKEYLNALNNHDFKLLSKLLQNFFRNSGLTGLWVYAYFQDIVGASKHRKRWFISNILQDLSTLYDFIDDLDLNALSTPLVGNPWGYLIDNILILPTSCGHYYYANHVKNLLSGIEYPVVAEIGGGFGGFAYYLLAGNGSYKYINFDLPEVLIIAQYYLMKSLPDRKFLLFGESEEHNILQDTINNYDIILMPNFSLPSLEDKTVDLFINTHSLSEMDYHTIEEYIEQIVRVCSLYFLHENSDRPRIKTMGEVKHTEIVSSEFPIPGDLFKRIYKHNSLWGGGGGRYREHLYQRR